MKRAVHEHFPLSAAGLMLALVLSGGPAHAQSNIQVLPNIGQQDLPNMGQQITPLAPLDSRFDTMNPDLTDMPKWLVGQAVTTVVSPDRKTLLVLTSGFNRVFNTIGPDIGKTNKTDSQEYVFIYDISMPTPVKKQVVKIPNTYNGIVFDPSGAAFYVAGGVDDNVHIITRSAAGTWGEQGENPPLALGHNKMGNGLVGPSDVGGGSINLQVGVKPCAAGVAISNDGQTLVVANYYNDSITVFKGGYGHWSTGMELDLRPGKSNASQAGVPGGEYPFWVVVKGNGSSATAYVSSIRDREIVVVDLFGAPAVTARIRVKGQPNKMTLNRAQSLLYVVEDQSDTIDVIDTGRNAILETIPVIAPASVMPSWLAQYTGANPNSVTLSPDETELYVTNGNLNCIAVVALSGTNRGDRVIGLIPTGWYPNSVSFSGNGNYIYVVNGKSPTGPNPDMCYSYGTSATTPTRPNCFAANQYNPQLIKAGFQSFPRPAAAQLATLSAQVAANNRFSSTQSVHDEAVMAAVRKGVRHVIFIIKENRTYDQILDDLEIGNGDPHLAEFGQAVTPNQHNLARKFVTLDNFYVTAEVSNDGWPWTTSARAPDVIERQFPLAYAGRGLSMDSEGVNRGVNVAYPTLGERRAANPLTPADPDLLPGQTDVAAPDGPDNEVNTGYLWDAALRAKLTVRNYGFFVDATRYALPSSSAYNIPLVRNPASTGTIVAFPANVSLDGGDHIDSHRSVAFVAGAYVKRVELISTQYNTIDFVRAIEEVLGLPPMNLNDALARPMADIFDTTPKNWGFKALPSAHLYHTKLPLPAKRAGLVMPKSRHNAKYWARVSKGMDFSSEDRFDFAVYNRVLWAGIMGNKPYPAVPTGLDLRQNREQLLARYRQSLK